MWRQHIVSEYAAAGTHQTNVPNKQNKPETAKTVYFALEIHEPIDFMVLNLLANVFFCCHVIDSLIHILRSFSISFTHHLSTSLSHLFDAVPSPPPSPSTSIPLAHILFASVEFPYEEKYEDVLICIDCVRDSVYNKRPAQSILTHSEWFMNWRSMLNSS